MDDLVKLIENKIKIKNNSLCSIIGSNPSKGARSPKLWNYAFSKMNINRKMIPLDVKKENLKDLLLFLKKNKKFIGSAVTNPFKEEILKHKLIKLSSIEKDIGAINCFYKKKNILYGINTDGIAALETLKQHQINLKNKVVLILGCGGAGKAIASYICSNISNKKNILIAIREPKKIKKFSNKLNITLLNWKKINEYIGDVDIVINTTVLGNINNLKKTPIKKSDFLKFKKHTFFFDINYQPRRTLFLKYAKEFNYKTCNGLYMNLSQASIAFNVVNNIKVKKNDTYELMRKIK
jgi:shikimate dehydrogenase